MICAAFVICSANFRSQVKTTKSTKRGFNAATAVAAICIALPANAQNQTETISPLVAGGLPFQVEMELVDWIGDHLPAIHSAAYATVDEQLLLVGGKTSGLHNFTCDPDVN